VYGCRLTGFAPKLRRVWRGRRSDYLLGGLGLVALANGLFLGLSLYALLAAALHILGDRAPSAGFAWLVGAVAALALLGLSLWREWALREGEYGPWKLAHATRFSDSHSPVGERFESLVAASSLSRSPALWLLQSPDPNAFAVGRSRDDASVVVTTGLLDLLSPEEQDAVLAHELAHIEREDLKAIGLADAVADSIGDLARIKGRYLWGPRNIVVDMRPFLIVLGIGVVGLSVLPKPGEGSVLLGLVVAGLTFYFLYAFVRSAFQSWRGLAQLFLLVSFFGPLSIVEAALAPPTAVCLSRLVARGRIHEADARGIELTGDREALISALLKLEPAELSAPGPWQGYLRFSVFVAARPQIGYQAWLARLYATHPSIASRIETIRETEAAPVRD
jgi:Zn-dependent protease with chaperone function